MINKMYKAKTPSITIVTKYWYMKWTLNHIVTYFLKLFYQKFKHYVAAGVDQQVDWARSILLGSALCLKNVLLNPFLSLICNWFTGVEQLVVALVRWIPYQQNKDTAPESPYFWVVRMCSSQLSPRFLGGVTLLGSVSRKGEPCRNFFKYCPLYLCHSLSPPAQCDLTPWQVQSVMGSGSPETNQGCFWPWEMPPLIWDTFWAGRSGTDLHVSKPAKTCQIRCPRTFQMY